MLAARTEVIPVPTTTVTDRQFLTGDGEGRPTVVAGVLRLPRADGEKLPTVVLVHGSGGLRGNIDYWQQQLSEIGVATFALDVFTARGITSTIENQDQLGRLAPIIDAYRALEVITARPWVDARRVVLMGFSRGAQVALYASLARFRNNYERSPQSFAAYIGFYTPCSTRYIDDENVADKPIRLFHGLADDYVPVAPCREYVQRLQASGKDVQLTEYEDAHHAFDNPLLPESLLPDAITARRCRMLEQTPGHIINAQTNEPFTFADPCIERGAHVGYNPTATAASTKAVKDFLGELFSAPGIPTPASPPH